MMFPVKQYCLPSRMGIYTFAFIVLSVMSVCVLTAQADEGYVREMRDQVKIFHDGLEMAIHHSGEALDKPYIHPLWTPDRRIVTYDAPADHVHHRALSVGWPDVSGTDFWAEIWSPEGRRGKIATKNLVVEEYPDGSRRIIEFNDWEQENGAVLIKGEHRWTFHPPKGNLYLVDLDLKLTAIADEVVFGSDPEKPRPYHGLTLRIGPWSNVRYYNSAGKEGGQNCRGVPAKWCAVSGDQHGRVCTTAILDSPKNSSHPARFYVQDRGMQFISSSPNYGEPNVLVQGQTWNLSYRVVAAGAPAEGEKWDIDVLWNEYADSLDK